MNYHFTRLACWFSHVVFLIANGTGCNPVYVRRYFHEWQQWERYLELLEIERRYSKGAK